MARRKNNRQASAREFQEQKELLQQAAERFNSKSGRAQVEETEESETAQCELNAAELDVKRQKVFADSRRRRSSLRSFDKDRLEEVGPYGINQEMRKISSSSTVNSEQMAAAGLACTSASAQKRLRLLAVEPSSLQSRPYAQTTPHCTYTIPVIPVPTPYLHRCTRKDCTKRFRSRAKLHTHIAEVHGHKPLDWLRHGGGEASMASLERKFDCHICGLACADEKRLETHIGKAHRARKSRDEGGRGKGKGQEFVVVDE